MCVVSGKQGNPIVRRPSSSPRFPASPCRRVVALLGLSLFGILVPVLISISACTKRNPDLCCTTDAECTAIGFSSHAPCDLGVCVKNECTTASNTCDDDTDCPATSPVCVAGTCATCDSNTACPASAPVCDTIAHDCRACTQDGECDSGACDIAVGTCIDSGHIRYASPTGTDAQPCSRTQPCSFQQASATVDAAHRYVVLLPGTHRSGGFFDAQTAIVCGSGALLEASNNVVFLGNGAVVTLRGFQIDQPDPNNLNDFSIINCNDCSLTLQDMTIRAASFTWDTISQFHGSSLDIQHSTLQGGNIHLSESEVTIDRSTFLDDIQIEYVNTGHSITIRNSLFDFSQSGSLDIKGTDATAKFQGAFLYNNTFSNGKLGCGANNFFPASFEANIFYNVSLLASEPNAPSDCGFTNNLYFPSLGITGTDNQTTDPLFVNAQNHEFHLQEHSPARDASARTLSDHDHDGAQRPQGIRPDLGAFEYPAPN